MSSNFCQTAVGSTLQFGRRNARIKALSATQLQVRDFADAAFANISGADALVDDDLVTLRQLNAVSSGLSFKESVRVCSMTGVTVAAPGASIDGIAMSVGDRVALFAQSGTPTENGLWVFQGAAVPMTRPTDWATGTEQSGSAFIIREGTCADNMYVASADPAVVDTDNPDLLLIATVTTGVTSVNNAVAPGAGQESLLASAGTGAVTTNIVGATGRIAVTLNTSVLTFDIVAGSIGTTQLADDGVTNAKLAPGAAVSYVRGSIDFNDAGTTVTLSDLQAPVPANSLVVSVSIRVSEFFDDTTVDVDIQVGGNSVMGVDLSDLNVVGQYDCNDLASESGAVTAVVGVATIGVTQGAADILLGYLRVA
jgi:hypothetical protein